MELDALELVFDGIIKPRDIKLSALQSITGNFAEERKVGEGGFGTVYKGVLQNGEVAVKRIRNFHTIDDKLFRREVNSLLEVNHENIVRFLGFCSHTEHKVFKNEESRENIYAEDRERILCFEYISTGSLEKHIADELRGLTWDTRYFIIKGICKGLHYLYMKRHILHMDLKPANILIDSNMVAKITDFGLSRMEENSQTKSANRPLSLGYSAPEYIDNGKMSVKSDVYSLGIIIIELVTGSRSIPDSNNVLRRWRHRLHKSGKETSFRHQQIAKLIEIGLHCQKKDPYKRPFISDIIHVINELESTNREISNVNECTAGQISPYTQDDMLGIEPLELCFPFESNNQMSCSLELTNETNHFIAFSIKTTSPLPYCIQPSKGIVAPQSKYSVYITLQPLDQEQQDRKYTGDFIVRSTKVNDSLLSEDINEDIFNRKDGKLVDEVNLTVKYMSEVPQVDVPDGSLVISETRNQGGPTEAESKASPCTLNELIQFDPPELSLLSMPNKPLAFLVNIVNNTDYYVGFARYHPKTNVGIYYTEPNAGVMPPRSTHRLIVRRAPQKTEHEDMLCEDKFLLWSCLVSEDAEASDFVDYRNYEESRELPIVYKKANLCSSDELIKIDPAQLAFSFLPNKMVSMFHKFEIANVTDHIVSYCLRQHKDSSAWYKMEPRSGILPPQSTQVIKVKRTLKENETDGMQYKDMIFVCNGIVTEGVKASDVDIYWNDGVKELPVVLTLASPCIPNELIQFDPPELSLPLMPNNPFLFSVNIVNSTDYFVGFATCHPQTNVGMYYTIPESGVMPPRSTQRLVVKRTPKKEEHEDMQCEDRFLLWSCLVNEGTEAIDFVNHRRCDESRELPIVYKKANLCSSDELIQIDPAELAFSFLPNNMVSMIRKFEIVNVTDHIVGYSARQHKDGTAWYTMEPQSGILPPQSTQVIKVKRTLKESETDGMQYKDKIFVWNGIVSEGVEDSELDILYGEDETKELPIVLKKASPCISNELIQFDPPELSLPFAPNKPLVFSVNIVNNTDYCVGFDKYQPQSNVGWFFIEPAGGVMPPRSTQRLVVKRVPDEKEQEDMLCEDRFLLWSCLVSEGTEASDFVDYSNYEESRQLPIVYKKASLGTSDELIQFDPPQLPFKFLPNKQVEKLRKFKIVNVTDHSVGFSTWSHEDNSAEYVMTPDEGILSPQSTIRIKVKRTRKNSEPQDIEWKDKIFVWNGIVTEGVEAGDVGQYWKEEDKELSVVLIQPGESSSR